MKKIEIKEVGITSAFKATIYLSIIPCALLGLLGLILTIIGLGIGEKALLALGVPYLIMPVFMLLLYGLFSMLGALIYNVFAKKYGGLELKIIEKQDAAVIPNALPNQHRNESSENAGPDIVSKY
jgi:hypothetical protein